MKNNKWENQNYSVSFTVSGHIIQNPMPLMKATPQPKNTMDNKCCLLWEIGKSRKYKNDDYISGIMVSINC